MALYQAAATAKLDLDLDLSVMISPVDVLSGEDLDCVGPIAFLIPSNMPQEFPVPAADWISGQRFIQKLLAQILHFTFARCLASRSASRELDDGLRW